MNPSKPTRTKAPAGNSMEGKATGGMAPKPQRDSVGNDQGAKSHYVRKSVGLTPTNIPRMKQQEGSAINGSKVDSVSSGPVQPFSTSSNKISNSKLKGVD